MDTNNLISTKRSALKSIFDTALYSWDVFLRNSTTCYSVLEFECLLAVWIHRCENNLTMTILTMTTRLLNILRIDVNFLLDCLLVCNLRSSDISFYMEFTKKTVNDDLKMKFTHTCDDCLACFLVCCNSEGWVFFSKLC